VHGGSTQFLTVLFGMYTYTRIVTGARFMNDKKVTNLFYTVFLVYIATYTTITIQKEPANRLTDQLHQVISGNIK
jgi:hypothetical protein